MRRVFHIVFRVVRGLGGSLAWLRRPEHRFQYNLVIGFAVLLMVLLLRDTSLVREPENAALDWMMGLYRGVALTDDSPAAFTYLDIDEPTFRAWGEPLITPRARLATMVRRVLEQGPAILVVDLDLSRAAGPDDAALVETIRRFAEGDGKTQVIFSRALRPSLDPQMGATPEQRPSALLEELVASHEQLHWASPLFNVDADGVIRRWRLWEPTCLDRQAVALPSVQLVAALLLDGQRGASLHDMHGPVDGCTPASLQGLQAAVASRRLSLNGHVVRLSETEHGDRILYTLSGQETSPVVMTPQGGAPLLTVRPAGLFEVRDDEQVRQWIAGRVVIIGASHSESFDRHLTPLGEMPGALVIVNSTLSLLGAGMLRQPPMPLVIGLQLLLVVVAAFLFSRLESFLGLLVGTAIVMLALVPLSIVLFRAGIWIDFVIPLVAIELHELLTAFQGEDKQPSKQEA